MLARPASCFLLRIGRTSRVCSCRVHAASAVISRHSLQLFSVARAVYPKCTPQSHFYVLVKCCRAQRCQTCWSDRAAKRRPWSECSSMRQSATLQVRPSFPVMCMVFCCGTAYCLDAGASHAAVMAAAVPAAYCICSAVCFNPQHSSCCCCTACAGEFSNAFACRLTLEPFREPATTPSGLSYERSALLNHIKSVSRTAAPRVSGVIRYGDCDRVATCLV